MSFHFPFFFSFLVLAYLFMNFCSSFWQHQPFIAVEIIMINLFAALATSTRLNKCFYKDKELQAGASQVDFGSGR